MNMTTSNGTRSNFKVRYPYYSNACRIFWLTGSAKCLGSAFRGSWEQFTNGRRPAIWGNFSELKLLNMEDYLENFRKI